MPQIRASKFFNKPDPREIPGNFAEIDSDPGFPRSNLPVRDLPRGIPPASACSSALWIAGCGAGRNPPRTPG